MGRWGAEGEACDDAEEFVDELLFHSAWMQRIVKERHPEVLDCQDCLRAWTARSADGPCHCDAVFDEEKDRIRRGELLSSEERDAPDLSLMVGEPDLLLALDAARAAYKPAVALLSVG